MDIVEYTEFLVKSISPSSDMVKVSSYQSEEEGLILEVLVPEDSMGAVIGREGRNAKALRTIIQAYAYLKEIGHVKVNIDSF